MIPMAPTGRFKIRRWNTFPVFTAVATFVVLVIVIAVVWIAGQTPLR
jgi:hypothetical protein